MATGMNNMRFPTVALIMALGACAGAAGSYLPPELDGSSEWLLIDLDGQKPLAGAEILLTIDRTQLKLSGNAGCNRFMGGFKDTGEQLEVGPLGLTKRFCGHPKGLMQQESQFVYILQGVSHLALDGNRLNAHGGNGSLVFVRSQN